MSITLLFSENIWFGDEKQGFWVLGTVRDLLTIMPAPVELKLFGFRRMTVSG